MHHNELAAQIVRQARIADEEGKGTDFAIVFAAMGVTHDVADYFRRSFEESGVLGRWRCSSTSPTTRSSERTLTRAALLDRGGISGI